MIKKFVFQLVALLFVMHGIVLSMHITKALRTPLIESYRQYYGVEKLTEDQNKILHAQAIDIAKIVPTLKNIEKRLEEQNKLLQAYFEVKKIEVESQICSNDVKCSPDWVRKDVNTRRAWLEKLSKINAKE